MSTLSVNKKYREDKKAIKALEKKKTQLSSLKQPPLWKKWKPSGTMMPKPNKKNTKTITKKLKAILLDLAMIYWKIKHTNSDWIWKCCTCMLIALWTTMQGWHFIPQSKWLATKFELDNINLQCAWCNWKANQWEQYKHWLYIDNIYGEGRAEDLHRQAQSPRQWKVWELEEAIEEVENRILALCKKYWIARTVLIVGYIVKDGSRKSNCKSLLAKIANETS